jgi:hypothetical protein
MPHENLLKSSRVYLSGPMDFVASRQTEKESGWRNRVGDFLRKLGVTVLDPWFKPEVRGLHEFGREGIDTTNIRDKWTYEQGRAGAEIRARISGKFWETMHIDLRMVDTSDFTIAYCPTNVYSVGTVHEIVMCRQQRKPVLFVSPPISFPSLQLLKEHIKGDSRGTRLLEQFLIESSIKENPRGVPSLWYMPLVGGEHFFDGFGFKNYIDEFHWEQNSTDDLEDAYIPKNPLLPYLEKIDTELPQKWDNRRKQFVRNDDWLIWDLEPTTSGGATLRKGLTR